MTHKKKVVMGRLVQLKDVDRSFDLEFWRRIGVRGKFEAAWGMVCDLCNWNKKYEPQQRLRRTVATLKLRPR